MVKKLKHLRVLCLLLCLFLFGCSDNAADSATDDSEGDTVGVIDEEQTIDTDRQTQTDPIESDTDAPDTTVPDTANDTTADTASDTDTEKPEDAVTDEINDSDTQAVSDTDTTDTDTTDTEEESTAPEEIEEIIAADEIDLGALSVGNSVSGQFISHQSEKMYLVVKYNCIMEADGVVEIALEAGLETYDINCGSRIDTGKLTVDGVTQIFSTEGIVHESRSKIYVPFTTYTCKSAEGQNYCSIDVSWLFNGTYAGKNIDTLTASAIIKWDSAAGNEA